MSAAESGSALATLRGTFIKAGTAILVIWALSWALGGLLSPTWAFVGFVVLASLSFATTRVGEFSVPFALSAVGVVAFAIAALEMVLPVESFLADALGVGIGGLNLWRLGVYAFIAVAAIWLIDIRITSAFRRDSGRPEAANPDTVARAFQRRVSSLLDDWRGVAVAFAFIGFLVLEAALGIVGDLGAEIFGVVGQIPVVSAFATYLPIVYTNMGGNLPVLSGLPFFGTLTPGEVGFLGVLLLLGAYFWREGDT